jgi:thiol-disulfide isomerase/thioredoxin
MSLSGVSTPIDVEGCFMTSKFLSEQFAAGLDYASYLATGTAEQQRRWTQFYDLASLTDSQKQLIGGFVRKMHVLIVSGIWCGDCVQQCPLLQRIAEAVPNAISLKLVDRDVHKELSSQLKTNAGDRVPVVIFLAEDFELCGVYGDRSLNRYRALAAKQLGPSCPIGVVPPDAGEVIATTADWVGEFERIQLMLRLSARLRQKHGD